MPMRLGGGRESIRRRWVSNGAQVPSSSRNPKPLDREVSFKVGPKGVEYDDIPDAIDALESYPNLAGDDRIAALALETVRSEKRYFESEVESVHKKWRVHQNLYRGKSIQGRSASDVHVPVFYQTVERLRAEINTPWKGDAIAFDIQGVDSDDQRRAQKLRNFIAYQLRENDIDRLDSDADIPALNCGIAVAKVYPAYETGTRLHREPMGLDVGSGNRRFRIQEEKVVLFQGARIALCDSFGTFIDPKRHHPNHKDPNRRSRFIGDESLRLYEDLMERQRQGQIMNVEQLAGQARAVMNLGASYRDDYDELRSSAGSAQVHKVTERWGLFRAYEGAPAEEYVIEIADDDVVLRVQRNPFYRQMRPYAVWKTNPEPFDTLSMTPLDHVVLLNIQMDRLFRLFMDASELQGCPIFIGRATSDIPTSMLSVRPGQVLNGDPDGLRPLPIAVKTQDLIRGMDICQRQIEETTGAYTMPGDLGGSDTATAVDAKKESMNKRVAALQESKATWKADVIKLVHEINRQYAPEEQTYQVIGRDAADLPGYGLTESITSEEMDIDIDIVFSGMARQKSTGLEAIKLQRFQELVMGIAQLKPEIVERIEWDKLLKHAARGILGYTASDPIVKRMPEDEVAVNPYFENIMLRDGKSVAVHPSDIHEEHIEEHGALMEELEDAPGEIDSSVKDAILEHLLNHVVLQQQAQTPQPQTQVPGQQAGALGAPGQGSAPVEEPGVSQSPQGVTPGPPNMERQRKIGRAVTPSQEIMNG